jgi:hypothetical protein
MDELLANIREAVEGCLLAASDTASAEGAQVIELVV